MKTVRKGTRAKMKQARFFGKDAGILRFSVLRFSVLQLSVGTFHDQGTGISERIFSIKSSALTLSAAASYDKIKR